jgi:hypothetical protein
MKRKISLVRLLIVIGLVLFATIGFYWIGGIDPLGLRNNSPDLKPFINLDLLTWVVGGLTVLAGSAGLIFLAAIAWIFRCIYCYIFPEVK